MTCMSRDLHKSIFGREFSFSLCIMVPVCCEAWSRHRARSPLFSFTCCFAHCLATDQLQTMTCCQVPVLLRLARQKEELGMQRLSEVLGFLLILEDEMQTVGYKQLCSKCSIFGQRNPMFFHVSLLSL